MRTEKVIGQMLGEEHALTPSDVLSKEFKRARFGGYERRDVDDFLERVADAIEDLIVQLRVLKEKGEEQRRTIDEFRDLEATLRNALVSSQRFGEEVLDSAKREAHVLLEEARLKKAQAQLEVSRVPTTLTRDIHILEQQRSRLRTEMIAILETHKNLLDSLVPEESVSMPTSFFDVGVQDSLAHDARRPQLSAPGREARERAPAGEPETEEDELILGRTDPGSGPRPPDGSPLEDRTEGSQT